MYEDWDRDLSYVATNPGTTTITGNPQSYGVAKNNPSLGQRERDPASTLILNI